MTYLAFRALVARIPGIAWVIVLTAVLLAGAVWGIEQHGRRVGARQVARAARADTTRRAIAAVDAAVRRTDRAVRIARVARARSDSSRAHLAGTRRLAAPALDSAPAIVQTLVAEQAAQIARDSITIALQVPPQDAALVERGARVLLDTARVHERIDEPPESRDVVKIVAVTVATVSLLLLLF